ncbi:LacI family DNA-binding transcriptional regulator [Aminipila luticellarii]|uniref:LacI family transcriptional regulator n=1 Tax=Aminipila luticellarii TaxID=2507160 RepID=A0A410PWR5_9FIRM|nr:LacI family DNA-binding transcriptional regulator [Aminipila luticellarii]QAT43367.1 LacI family transcriptional regulator [Aminipila luticellarii]
MKKSITIKEIAEEAQVSIATVSMVLNKKDKKISEATRKKIHAIAQKYNYTPNTMARSLITRQTRTIGLIIPDIVNPFFPEIARGVEDKASEFGYSVIYCNTDDKIKREDKYINVLTEKMVDGIIFAHSSDRQLGFDSLDKCKVPILLIDRDYENRNVIGRVVVDNREGAYMATSYLLDRGYRKIAYIAGSITTTTARGRLEGYNQALAEREIPVNEHYIKVGEYKLQWGVEAADQLLHEKEPIDAIFCGNDLIAIGAIRKLKECGLRVPEDIGIVGFDDIYLASLVEPPLTTIKQPNYEMGYKAAELLIKNIEKLRQDKIKHENNSVLVEKNTVFLPTELIVRRSAK